MVKLMNLNTEYYSFVSSFLLRITITLLSILILICYTTLPINAQNSAEEYFYSGVEKLDSGDFQGAIKDFNKAIGINPKYAKAYYGRGVAKLGLWQKDSGCLYLSKPGELGYSEAYESIKKYCN